MPAVLVHGVPDTHGIDEIGEPVDLVSHDWGCLLTGRLPSCFADELGNATHARAVVKLRSSHWPTIERPADVARELEAHWTHV
ncbi:MAG TPA: hypothetical protein VGD45_10670 [Steroidobacter sp.]|uniref:hypothetical protein n=1 Tax=Steroidobacter sp. TaxID=1978227 RepID=UPI002EDB1E5A